MLDADHVGCTRGDRPLFGGLSFSLAAGEILYITGRNGSGKTTLLRTLCGLSRPAQGTIRWQGTDIRRLGDEYHAVLGYIGHHNGIQGELTPYENLHHAQCLGGRAARGAIMETLTLLGLAPYRQLAAKLLSQGQKRRLALGRLLLLQRPLWVLDEPYTALDAQSTALMQELLDRHVNGGGLAVITSHQTLSLTALSLRQICIDDVRN